MNSLARLNSKMIEARVTECRGGAEEVRGHQSCILLWRKLTRSPARGAISVPSKSGSYAEARKFSDAEEGGRRISTSTTTDASA